MPEPVTLIGFTGGMVGVLMHFGRRYFDLAKEIMDIVLGFVILLMVLPLLALCATVIKLSSKGPVFYVQRRVGQSGRVFEMYKLRTMHVNAESGTGPMWAKSNDPRVIGACRWMRRSHVDELPQLINVIKGDMSLVGPRPERPEIIAELKQTIPDFEKRLAVRPGITGLAQVRNGYDGSLEGARRKLEADLEYIGSRRWRTELQILAATLNKVYDKGAN